MAGPYIYVASSWRNQIYNDVLTRLRDEGFDCFDFKAPGAGFSWSEVDPNWINWAAEEYIAALDHPAARRGFARDMGALKLCDALVLVLPCGRSAHLEAGWATGAGRHTIVLTRDGEEPELMANMCDLITASLNDVVASLRGVEPRGRAAR